MSIREDEYSEYTWALSVNGEVIGVVDDLDKAEQVLRSTFLSDKDWTEEEVGKRLRFDLKFNTWILFFDWLPEWNYQACRVPKL